MALVNAISEAVSRRGGTLITRIKQDLRAAGKSATGELINNTKGETRIVGNATVLFEGKAPEHYDPDMAFPGEDEDTIKPEDQL